MDIELVMMLVLS